MLKAKLSCWTLTKPKIPRSTTFFLQPQASPTRVMHHYKPRAIPPRFPASMAAPVAIGTRGTVGSLVRKEIEYFRSFELEKSLGSIRKPQRQQVVDVGSSSSGEVSRLSSFWSLKISWKKKKKRGSSGSSNGTLFLPSICSAVEVANGHSNSNRFKGVPGFNYRILKNDAM